MEKAKQSSTEFSSSFDSVLFGHNESSKSSSSSLVESIFSTNDKNRNSDLSKKEREPCYYNSSIYYGAQEIYSTATQNNIPKQKTLNKEEGDCASRGNWWKGSLYY